jgi:tricorn protease
MVDGRVGNGLAEFLRGYRAQFDREGLIVDVRWNSGGHISPDILDWLTRERIGASVHRRGLPDPLPYLSPRGPMVALVNELTASDGEIFSHLFRALGLGPLIGMRTWGGVIGITHDKSLADGTVPTQPAGAIRFTDVGFEIENRGVDPVADPARDRDKQVDIAPQDYRRGADPQLERAIVEALRQIAAHTMRTPLPDAANQDDDHRRAG